jgi:hypothetical protein
MESFAKFEHEGWQRVAGKSMPIWKWTFQPARRIICFLAVKTFAGPWHELDSMANR